MSSDTLHPVWVTQGKRVTDSCWETKRTETTLEEAVERANRRRQRELAQAQRRVRLAALAAHEEWVMAGEQRERAVLLDAGGAVITRKEGDRSQVVWAETALQPLIGRVDLIVHNHPGGTSLGENDLDLALFLNAREVMVVTNTRRYRLHRRRDAWPPDRELLSAVRQEQAHLADEMVAARDVGLIDDARIERTFYHVLWERVARRYADRLSYDVERRG